MENDKKKLITREEYNQMIDRIIEITDQANRLLQTLKDYDEGREFTLAFNENVYLELAEIRRSARSYIATIMEHLLKLKYCTNNRNHNDWRTTISKAQSNFKKEVEMKSKTPNTTIINDVEKSMDELYYFARNLYIDTAEKFSDLEDGVKYLPETCPWTFKEVLTDRIDELVIKLPDPEELTVQMQLTPICKYLDINANKLDSEIIRKQCSECESYPQCIADYYERK